MTKCFTYTKTKIHGYRSTYDSLIQKQWFMDNSKYSPHNIGKYKQQSTVVDVNMPMKKHSQSCKTNCTPL